MSPVVREFETGRTTPELFGDQPHRRDGTDSGKAQTAATSGRVTGEVEIRIDLPATVRARTITSFRVNSPRGFET
jgi:hypothetical protein